MRKLTNTALTPDHEDYFAVQKAKIRNEIGQAIIRCMIGLAAIFITLLFNIDAVTTTLFYLLLSPFLFLTHGIVSLSIAYHLKNKSTREIISHHLQKKENHQQRNRYWRNIILDQILITSCLVSVGTPLTLFLAAYAWLPLDHGLRFGKKYIYYCALMSLIGLGILMFGPLAWQDFKIVGFGMMVNVIFTALYGGRFLEEMRKANIDLAALASRDHLTQLPNRRYFMSRMSPSMKATSRTDAYLGCVFIDLDGFKKVNDTYGHAIGDALLIKIGQTISLSLRDTDMVARLGGDEFAILAQYFKIPTDINQMCKRVQDAVRIVKEIEGCSINVSASIGVALYKEIEHSQITEADLIRSADNAMYAAKRNGKDQVYISMGGKECIDLITWTASQNTKRKVSSVNSAPDTTLNMQFSFTGNVL